MSTSARGGSRIPYAVSFTLLTVLLGGGTVAFVLGVLPQRFTLQAGLRESGASFPAKTPAFGATAREPLVRPRPAAPATTAPAPEPGPAQRLWSRVLPLLRSGRYEAALPAFRAYLDAHPGDDDVLREYATTLQKAGRADEAEAAWRRLAARSDDFQSRLALARLLRDRGRTDEAMAQYRALSARRPGDWALRLEEARALLWAGRPGAARDVLALLPDSLRGRPDARRLTAAVDSALTPPSPAVAAAEPARPTTTLERARAAAAHDSLALASSLYADRVRRHPGDADAWKAWADLLELRMRDYDGAAKALGRWIELTGGDAATRVRLARLQSWAGHQDAARATLEALVARRPGRADAWAWLGDVRRYQGDRPGAAEAYDRALALDPGSERARSGRQRLAALTEQVLAAREPRRVGPDGSLFLDSDHFRRVDAAAFGRARSGSLVLEGRAGYRFLHGRTLGGPLAERSLQGVFADVDLARWWRQATVRTSVSLGLEDLEVLGTRPHWGAGLEIPDLDGAALSATYQHEPAYPLTRTLESVLEPVTADQLSLSLYRPLGGAWSLLVSSDLALLSAAPADNVRVAASITLRRRVTAWLTAGYVSRWVGFGSPAPVVGGTPGGTPGRRLYWDPSSFWSHQLLLEAGTAPGSRGWGAHLGLRPGFAFLDERGLTSTTVPQFELDADLERSGPWGDVTASLFYGRAREGGYHSFGGQLGLRVRVP